LNKVPARDMRTGFRGKSLEDALQTLLKNYPEIIPGSQIDPLNDDPPRFALLRREMPVAGWSLGVFAHPHITLTREGKRSMPTTRTTEV